MSKETGPSAAAKSVLEDVKGKAKEVIGEVTNDDDKAMEGRAQQRKAESERDVAKNEAKAEAARGEAKAHEMEQRAASDK